LRPNQDDSDRRVNGHYTPRFSPISLGGRRCRKQTGKKEDQMLSDSQRNKFFPLMLAAWQEHREVNNLADNYEQRDAWYRDEMAKVCRENNLGENIDSIKKLDRLAGYDHVMLNFAMIACDDRAISYFSQAVERRYRHVVKEFLSELSGLEQRDCGWDYARQIASHMNLPLRLEECPHEMLQKVIQAVDTHRRRILAARGQLDTKKPGLGSKQ